MGRGKSLIGLLVIALGIGAYVYFVEMKRDLTDPETKKTRVFTVESGKIDEVEVHAASGDVTTVRKQNDAWSVTAPTPSAADMSSVGSLVSSLETLDIDKVLDEKPADVASFGLKPPRYSITFKAAGDPKPHTLNVGSKTPTGTDLYAQVDGDPRLLLISSFLDDMLNKSTFDLRDKTALKFPRETLDLVSIEAPGKPTVTIAKKGEEWRLTSPVEARADFGPVDGIANRVSQLQMKSVVAGDEPNAPPPSAADLKLYGLDKPQVTATFGAGSTRATLALGGKKDEATIYARDLSRPVIFTVESSLVADLTKKPEDLRIKDIFEFKSFTATGLDLTYGGTAYAFAKTPAAAGDKSAVDTWKQTKPEAKDVNQTAMTDLLNSLSSLRADTFADKAAASGEDLVVVARFGDAASPTEERVTLRKSGGTVQAIRANEPGAAVVPAADFDKAIAQLKTLTGAK